MIAHILDTREKVWMEVEDYEGNKLKFFGAQLSLVREGVNKKKDAKVWIFSIPGGGVPSPTS